MSPIKTYVAYFAVELQYLIDFAWLAQPIEGACD